MQSKQLTDNEKYDIVFQIILSLNYLHTRKIFHRDIKSGNILINDNGEALLADFGLAKKINYRVTNTQLGTPTYMAPEVMQGSMYDERADVWSLGILAYEMVTGKLPFLGRNIGQLSYAIQQGRYDKQPLINSKLKDIIEKFLIVANRPYLHAFLQGHEQQVTKMLKSYPLQLQLDYPSIYQKIQNQHNLLLNTLQNEEIKKQEQLKQQLVLQHQQQLNYYFYELKNVFDKMFETFKNPDTNFLNVMNTILDNKIIQQQPVFTSQVCLFRVEQFHSDFKQNKMALLVLFYREYIRSTQGRFLIYDN